MRLMDSNEVCDLLGISKSTLFRWCGVSDSADDNSSQTNVSLLTEQLLRNSPFFATSSDETPYDFPRPFKIGRAYKWKDTEIMDWLQTKRV